MGFLQFVAAIVLHIITGLYVCKEGRLVLAFDLEVAHVCLQRLELTVEMHAGPRDRPIHLADKVPTVLPSLRTTTQPTMQCIL